VKYNSVKTRLLPRTEKSNKQKRGQDIPSPAKTTEKYARNPQLDLNSLLFLLDSPANCIKVSFTHIEPHLNCEISRFWIDLSFENTYMLSGCSLLAKNTNISKHIIIIRMWIGTQVPTTYPYPDLAQDMDTSQMLVNAVMNPLRFHKMWVISLT
jgi:hypothetical protein